MMATTNQQLLNDIYSNFPVLKEKISNGFNKYYYYCDIFKEEGFEENLRETVEESIERVKGIHDRLDEMIKRNELSNKKAKETIEILYKMIELFDGIIKNTEDDKEKLVVRNNELVDKLIDLEQRKTLKLIGQNVKNRETYKGMFGHKKEELNKLRIKARETFQKQIVVPISKPSINNLDENEIKQIEEWTQMKIGNIIFDSNVDDWKVNTSVFGQKIINKSNLIFLIEDTDGNKFGGFIEAKIVKYGEWLRDSYSFVFSLKSNGRLNGMLKFEIDCLHDAFAIGNQSNDRLFGIGNGWFYGNDIMVFKENKKTKSFCEQIAFNYHGTSKALCGKTYFNPKRITVFQLQWS